ncbi:hypothetical protein, partial [Helicobacter felis]|uniref:hypothetical protein n=1 Tax=Helicobacter felis TaxID=214 RepID=UPI001F349059
ILGSVICVKEESLKKTPRFKRVYRVVGNNIAVLPGGKKAIKARLNVINKEMTPEKKERFSKKLIELSLNPFMGVKSVPRRGFFEKVAPPPPSLGVCTFNRYYKIKNSIFIRNFIINPKLFVLYLNSSSVQLINQGVSYVF